MRYWEPGDGGATHIVTRPYRRTLCGERADGGRLVGQVRPSRRGVCVTGVCEACLGTLREPTGDGTARS